MRRVLAGRCGFVHGSRLPTIGMKIICRVVWEAQSNLQLSGDRTLQVGFPSLAILPLQEILLEVLIPSMQSSLCLRKMTGISSSHNIIVSYSKFTTNSNVDRRGSYQVLAVLSRKMIDEWSLRIGSLSTSERRGLHPKSCATGLRL